MNVMSLCKSVVYKYTPEVEAACSLVLLSGKETDLPALYEPVANEPVKEEEDQIVDEPEPVVEKEEPKIEEKVDYELLNYLKLKSAKSAKPTPDTDYVPIGYGHTKVPRQVLKHLNWSSYTSCTRKLLITLFPRNVLATHSLTGKSSPAFPNKPAKKKLDPVIIDDIVKIVSERCAVKKSLVRTSITTKCADECKMQRTRLQKMAKGKKIRKEVGEENKRPQWEVEA